MLFDDDMEKDTFRSIGLQAALILNRLRLQAQLSETNAEDQFGDVIGNDGNGDDGADKKPEHDTQTKRAIR